MSLRGCKNHKSPLFPEGIREHDEATVKHIVDVGRINKALNTTDDWYKLSTSDSSSQETSQRLVG